jgi:hypothetical protein
MNRQASLFLWLLVMATVPLGAAEPSFPARARVTGDEVRIRASASLSAPVKGVLFKNMLVMATARGAKIRVGDKESFWYRVEGEGISGWSFGGFLNFDLSDPVPDTYVGSDDLSWFFKRFGESTWEYPQKISSSSFTLDEYRSLITTVEKGEDYSASYALYYSLFSALRGGAKDPSSAYLARKVHSLQFLTVLLNRLSLKEASRVLPLSWRDDEDALLSLDKIPSDLLSFVSDRLKSKKDFVARVIDRNPENFFHLSDRFQDDRDISLSAIKGGAVRGMLDQVSDRLKDDPVFLLEATGGSAGPYCEFFNLASERLRSDKDFRMKMLSKDSISSCPEDVLDDKEIVLAAVRRYGSELRFASARLQDDEDVVRAALAQGGTAMLEFASPRLQEKLSTPPR